MLVGGLLQWCSQAKCFCWCLFLTTASLPLQLMWWTSLLMWRLELLLLTHIHSIWACIHCVVYDVSIIGTGWTLLDHKVSKPCLPRCRWARFELIFWVRHPRPVSGHVQTACHSRFGVKTQSLSSRRLCKRATRVHTPVNRAGASNRTCPVQIMPYLWDGWQWDSPNLKTPESSPRTPRSVTQHPLQYSRTNHTTGAMSFLLRSTSLKNRSLVYGRGKLL